MAKAILVAEDSQDDAILFARALEKARLENPIFVVADGAEAIAYLRGEPPYGNREKYPLPAILFLDLKMPRVHGREVLQWVRSQPHLKEILVFVTTHFDDTKTFADVYALGAKFFLVKPVKVTDLGNLIHHFPGHWEQAPSVRD